MGPLDQWLLANANKIDLRIRFFDNKILKTFGIHDIEAKISVDGKEYSGRGTYFDKEIALKKACGEAIERFFLHRNKFQNSNGMAVHSNAKLAIDGARLELIERDLFLCRYITQTPYLKIPTPNDFMRRIGPLLKNEGIGLNFYTMGMINSKRAILCAIDGFERQDSFGYILGSASGDSNSILVSSFLEAFRNFAHYEKGSAMSEESFAFKNSVGSIEFKDHGNLALDVQYALALKADFFSSFNFSEKNESLNLDFQYEIITMDDTPFKNAPIAAVRATSQQLQNLYVGNISKEVVNEKRIKSFCLTYNRPFQLYQRPHPFN
jgi:hypothetical protein